MILNANVAESASLAEAVKECKKVPVVVRRKGRAVAVLIAVANEDEVDQLIYAHCKPLHESLARSEQQLREGKGIPAEEFWKMLDAEYAEEDAKKPRKKTAAPRSKKATGHKNEVPHTQE